MASIPLLSGIYTDERADFRQSLPRNLVPVLRDTGISKGYIRSADGLATLTTGPGTDRGGINWRGACIRVMGSSLVSVSAAGVITTLGDVGDGGRCRFDYGFDRLAIASGARLWYWDGTTLTQVTDPDLGQCLDVMWVDGYFMTTDGEFVVTTELTDPTAVLTTKYGSSEADPDPVVAVRKLRNEPHVINRYTVEVFQNVGGTGFPFQRVPGAIYERGAIGTHMVAPFLDSLAFVGSKRNEPPAVWILAGGSTAAISSAEVDQVLRSYTEAQLADCHIETRVEDKRQTLLIHLPDQTLAYDGAMSQVVGEPIWYTLGSSKVEQAQYRAQGLVWCDDRWVFGDPQSSVLGVYDRTTDRHYSQPIGWEFGTVALYSEDRNVIVHELLLTALPGRAPLGADPVVWHSYSRSGRAGDFGQERPSKAGKTGETATNIQWRRCGFARSWRVERFRGVDTGPVAFAKIEAEVEVLNV